MKVREILKFWDDGNTWVVFWDTHDLTDFEDELEEVTEPVFEYSFRKN
jgi:hypothetical protein